MVDFWIQGYVDLGNNQTNIWSVYSQPWWDSDSKLIFKKLLKVKATKCLTFWSSVLMKSVNDCTCTNTSIFISSRPIGQNGHASDKGLKKPQITDCGPSVNRAPGCSEVHKQAQVGSSTCQSHLCQTGSEDHFSAGGFLFKKQTLPDKRQLWIGGGRIRRIRTMRPLSYQHNQLISKYYREYW